MFPRPSGLVTLTTDFGVADPYVGIVKGAVARATTKPQVIDLSHAVPPQDVAAGAFVLWTAIGRFPDGTVHCGIVDPGVGAARRLLAACAVGQYWLAPDNGLLGAVLARDGAAEVREVDLDHLRLRRDVGSFDGRDVFAPVAAMLSAGRYGFSAVGPRVALDAAPDPVFDGGHRVVHVDRYGNLVTNVTAAAGGAGAVEVAGTRVALQQTRADVEPGALLAYVGSFGLVEVASRGGSAASTLGVGRGAPVAVAIA
ncbi:MAG: SAM hydrolase/SAM-dependent halogenase family protein [Planctomycetota bacterium]